MLEYIPPSCVPYIVLIFNTLVFHILRRIFLRFSPTFIQIIFAEIIATLELCSGCAELGVVYELHGYIGLGLALLALCFWWCRVWGDAEACPCGPMEECIFGNGLDALVMKKLFGQAVGGAITSFWITYIWSLHMTDEHEALHTSAECQAGLQVHMGFGAVIEGIITLISRIVALQSVNWLPEVSILINAVVTTVLVLAGFSMGCGASVDNDSDSQASLEEWEKVQRRRRSGLSDLSDDDSDNEGGYRKELQEKSMKASGFQQGASIAIVDEISYPTARVHSSMTNASEDEGLFLDNDFPPSEATLYHSKRTRDPHIIWLRPHELTTKPELLVDGVSRHDIVQGILADCWFLSACSAVAQIPHLMEKVIPPNQSLSGEGYKGIITFRFWRFGHWITVYVDDLLPTRKRKLIFSKSSEPREFWVSLLEKAYAKLHGSYEALEGGQAMDALVDLTGGLAEMYALESAPPHLYNFLLQASLNGAFITCSRKGDWKAARKADSNGLVSGHAYTISAVATVKLSTGSDAYLVRIRNPWGIDTEWNGKWNDSDTNWHNVDINTKEKIEYIKRGDGEFWMSYQDFCREFEEVTICSLTPDLSQHSSLKSNSSSSDGPLPPTTMNYIHGRWEENKTCGGSRNNLVSFANNPQFLLTLPSKTNREDTNCNIVVALMQLRRRCVRHPRRKMLQIAFVLFKVKEPERQTIQNFLNIEEVGNSGPYVNYREVFGRFQMSPGHYIIVPATFEPNSPGSFYIRVYSDTQTTVREL